MLLTQESPPADALVLARRAQDVDVAVANARYRPPWVAPWIDAPLVALDYGRIWLLTPTEHDPVRTADGRYVIPGRPLRELRQRAATSAQFHHIAIAHELDSNGLARQLLPDLANGPRMCSDQAASHLVGPVPAHPGVARLSAMMELFSAGAVQLARAGWVAVVGASVLLHAVLRDPIIFGIVGADGPPMVGETALWYPLTAWEW
jgi:hypothetical protein